MTKLDILVVLQSLKMEENLINFNTIEEKLNMNIKHTSTQELNDFFNNYKNYVFILQFNNWTEEIEINEVYKTNKIIKKNKDYNRISKQDELPLIPDNFFIFGEDISGDLFILDSTNNDIYYSGELTFYTLVKIGSLYKLTNKKLLNDKIVDIKILKFTHIDIEHIIKELCIENDNIYSFFEHIKYGLIDSIPFEYLSNGSKYTTIIEKVYCPEKIINKNKLQKNKNFLIFGTTGGGFEIFIDLNTMLIHTLEEQDILFYNVKTFYSFFK